MPKHIHADLMLQYAQDAQESETPWENWEFYSTSNNTWKTLDTSPAWYCSNEYRRKPKMKVINGFEVPMPMQKEPEVGSCYYCPSLVNRYFHERDYYSSSFDKELFNRGLCFAKVEDAIATAKAMLGINPWK